MNTALSRWLRAAGSIGFVVATLSVGTGCGALKAAANPKVAWALNDPAPMSVVVRRADVAEKTSQEVDRLMTETPANDDSPWLKSVGPNQEDATKQLGELKTNELYQAGARVVAAEVWAKSLSSVEPKTAANKPVAVASAAKHAEPAAPAAKEAAPAADPVATAEPKPVKKGGKGAKGKGKAKPENKKLAKKSTTPPPPPAPAAAAKDEPSVSTTTTTAATVPASATPSNAKYTSILAAVDKDLGSEWAKVMEKKKAMGEVKGQIAVLETANDAKEITDADKKANKAKIADLEKQLDALEKEADQLAKEFIPKAKTAAKSAPADVRDRLGPALVNLRQAVDDANTANGAAVVRYPLAATSLLDSAKQMAKIYVADIVEEKTGKRPSLQSIQPGVTMEGGKVAVTINGLSQSDLGKLSIGDVTSETASRTTAWVKRALGLLGTTAATKEVLDFEDEVLGALIDGFASAGWQAPAPVTIPEAPKGPAGHPNS